jgi:hypothetical protein
MPIAGGKFFEQGRTWNEKKIRTMPCLKKVFDLGLPLFYRATQGFESAVALHY